MMSTDQKCCVNLLQPNKNCLQEAMKNMPGMPPGAYKGQAFNAVVSAPGFYWGLTWGVAGFPGALDQER